MTLEGAIHARWAAAEALNELLPVERFFTGEPQGTPPPPYAMLRRGPAKVLARTNAGSRIEEIECRFEVWTPDIEEGKAIVAELSAAFDQAAFTFDGGAALDFRRVNREEKNQPDGTWSFACVYSALVRMG